MDWSRAKTILIWAFLVLDLFLAWHVYTTRTRLWTAPDVVQGEAANLETYLAGKGISLAAEVPQETPVMTYLNVEYQWFPAEGMKELPGQQLTLEQNGIVSRFLQPIPVPDGKNQDDLLKVLSQRVMHAEQYRHDPVMTRAGRLVFWQMYEKRPLFVAPLEVYVEDGRAVGYRQTLVQIRNLGTGRQVISAYVALRSLVDKEIIQDGERIEDVSLGYYGHTYDANIQVLAPVWRIVHSGQVHYVNGFTGIVERPEEEGNSKQTE